MRLVVEIRYLQCFIHPKWCRISEPSTVSFHTPTLKYVGVFNMKPRSLQSRWSWIVHVFRISLTTIGPRPTWTLCFFFCPRFGPMFSSCVPETNSEWIRIVYSLYFQLIELFLSWHFCLRVGPRLKLFSLQKEQLTSKLDDTSHSRMVNPIVSYATSYHIHITSYKSTKSIQIIPITISYHTPYHMLV